MSYVGMPAHSKLDLFGQVVEKAFGQYPYLVGSALTTKDWRDVDVRLILPDDEYLALFPHGYNSHNVDGKWNSLCLAYSALAKEMTGLPVDFQIQTQSHSQDNYGPGKGKGRNILGLEID